MFSTPARPKLVSRVTAAAILLAGAAVSAQETNSVERIDLPTALRLAGAQNLDVQKARASLAEAQAAHESARLKFFPWITPGVSYLHHEGRIQETGGRIFDVSRQSYTIGPTVRAEVDFGEAIYEKLAARQRVAAAEQALEARRQQSVLEAAAGYFDLAQAYANVVVAGEAIRISREYQRQISEAVAAGLAFKGDELRVQVQTERYEVELRQAEERARTAAARLATILHLDPAVDLAPVDVEPLQVTLVPADTPLDTLVARAVEARPELKQSHAAVSAARHSRRGAKFGPLVPTISAQAFVGGMGGGPGSSTGNFGRSEDYGVSAGWRIGPGGLFDSSRIKAAEARLSFERLAGEQLHDQIVQEVVQARVRVRSLASQLTAIRANLATAAESLRLTVERRELAVGAVLEVIQAQQELTRARYDFIGAVADYNEAQYSLSRAIGELAGGPYDRRD